MQFSLCMSCSFQPFEITEEASYTNKYVLSVAYYFLFFYFFYFQQQPAQFTNPETPGYVGFANLPNQVHRKSVKKGFEFTLMVVGKETFYSLSQNQYLLTGNLELK